MSPKNGLFFRAFLLASLIIFPSIKLTASQPAQKENNPKLKQLLLLQKQQITKKEKTMQRIEEECGYWPTMPIKTPYYDGKQLISPEEMDPTYNELYGGPDLTAKKETYCPTKYQPGLDYELNPTDKKNPRPNQPNTTNNDNDYEPYLYGN